MKSIKRYRRINLAGREGLLTKQEAESNIPALYLPPPDAPVPPPISGFFNKSIKSRIIQSGRGDNVPDILRPNINELITSKAHLKKANKKFHPVSYGRNELFGSDAVDYYAIAACQKFLHEQSLTLDIISLNFGGIDQLTDAMFVYLKMKQANFACLTKLSLSGCYHLTDESFNQITQKFPGLQEINVKGCNRITERSLHYILSRCSKVHNLNMMGTEVSLIPPHIQNVFDGSIKFDGCPLISPRCSQMPTYVANQTQPQFDKLFHLYKPLKTYKLMIVPDPVFEVSIAACLTGDSDLRRVPGLGVWTKWTPQSVDATFNVFEVDGTYVFADLAFSDGCIVMFPYSPTESNYFFRLKERFEVVRAKCPNCVFVLMAIGAENNLDPEKVKQKIMSNITAQSEDIDAELAAMTKKLWMVESLDFMGQNTLTRGVVTAAQLKDTNLMSVAVTLDVDSDRAGSISSRLKHLKNEFIQKPSKLEFLHNAVELLKEQFPWQHYPMSPEVHEIIRGVPQLPFGTLIELYNETPKALLSTFNQCESKFCFEKIVKILHRVGSALCFEGIMDMEKQVVTDLQWFAKIVNALVQMPKQNANHVVKCAKDVACWYSADIHSVINTAVNSTEQVQPILDLLGHYGCLLTLPGDASGNEPYCYVVTDRLQSELPIPLKHLWPDDLPENDVQVEKFYYFPCQPPGSFIYSFFRSCMNICQVTLLGSTGFFVQQGAVDLLVDFHANYRNHYVMIVSARMQKLPGNKREIESQTLWSVMNIFTLLLDYQIDRYDLFAKVTVPCPTCLPCKNRFTILSHSEHYHFLLYTVLGGWDRGVTCRQETNPPEVVKEDLLGPDMQTVCSVHDYRYHKLVDGQFQKFTRCFHCHNCVSHGAACEKNMKNGDTSRDCACEATETVCSSCGMCRRCVSYLAKIEKILKPGFSSSRKMLKSDKDKIDKSDSSELGSMLTFNTPGTDVKLYQPMSAEYFNMLSLTLLRGNGIEVNIKTSKHVLVYHVSSGKITDEDGNHMTKSPEVTEGNTIGVQVRPQESLSGIVVDLYLNGHSVYSEESSSMQALVSLRINQSVSCIMQTPGLKLSWLEKWEVGAFTLGMLLEYEMSRGLIVPVYVESCSSVLVVHSVQFPESHASGAYQEQSFEIAVMSPLVHPPGYAKAYNLSLNVRLTSFEVSQWWECLPMGKRILPPLYLFNEFQSRTCQPNLSDAIMAPMLPCTSSIAPAVVECRLGSWMRKFRNILFKDGGIDFTGTPLVMLPSNFSDFNVKWPSRLHLQSKQCHPLCYIRGDVNDMVVTIPTNPVSVYRNPYHQLHFIDAPGFPYRDEPLSPVLLWAWHYFMCLQSEIPLPDYGQLFPRVTKESSMSDLSSAIQKLLWFQSCQLSLMSDDDIDISFFRNSNKMAAVESFRHVIKSSGTLSGLTPVQIMFFNQEVSMCPAHGSAMLSNKNLTEFPMETFGSYAKFIGSLAVPLNQINSLPEDFFMHFPSLLDLDISSNNLMVIPDGIGRCMNLLTLLANSNHLSSLPEDIVDCQKLYHLDLSSNLFEKVPKVITQLKNMKCLYLQKMLLKKLPKNIGDMEKLERLYLNGNCFTRLPESFQNLKNLREISMNGVAWFNMKSKTVLSRENFVEFLRTNNLLEWLEAHGQNTDILFDTFDANKTGFLETEELGHVNAALFHLFPRFGHWDTEPPVDDSPIGFPEEILSLKKLKYLSMQNQGLVSLPTRIDTLTNLNVINLSNNPYLMSIPAQTGNLPLKRLELLSCPSLKTPPKEIREKGFMTTYAYLKRLLTGASECKRTKLMLVGLGGAGKTSLVRALLSGQYKTDLTVDENITDGIDINTWTIHSEDDHVTFSVWDFAGQTVYYNTHQFFLSDRAVYLLLWNIRLGHEHAGLDFWLSSISVHAPKAPIFVVGTHLDQVSKTELPTRQMQERYPQIVGFHFVSSHTGMGVSDLQGSLLDVTLKQPYMGERIPGVWLSFENAIIAARSKESVIEYTHVEKMANQSGIFDKIEVSQAIQFLHELGSLQHFTNEFLKSYVVINPQWIVDVMACVVSVKDSAIKEGRLHHDVIDQVWRAYPEKLHHWLLRLTEEFDLTFPLPDQKVNLVPCLLTEKQPKIDWPDIDKNSEVKDTKMIYKFVYLPAGLFNRGQVRMHQISDSSVIWKRGTLLRKNGHIALIQQTKDSELIVQVQGSRPENILFMVHEVFEGLIAESFQGVTYDLLLPCPDCQKMIIKDPHMFSSHIVRRAVELKAPFLQCLKFFHTISVVELLACMPPDNNADYDIHLVQAVRGLKDLRKDLAADLFISYCPSDIQHSKEKMANPAHVTKALEKSGYKCWFNQDPNRQTMDEMAKALIDAQAFVAFISNDYVKDEDCCNIFKYARIILKKPIVVVTVGRGMEWRQSHLGILLADEVFINMQRFDRYESKLDELMKTLKDRNHKHVMVEDHPPCFISYCWQNSQSAINLGTRHLSGSVGWGDPRELKEYLELKGIKCWLDVERAGVNGLFDDIAEGLIHASVVVVCVSDEYAASQNCMMEFRYAANTLKVPIIVAVMGTGSVWRASEIGILTLGCPIINFQDKSDTTHERLLQHVNKYMSGDAAYKLSEKQKKDNANKDQKDLSFQELYELAQRKFLRQIVYYAEQQDISPYPRLLVTDFIQEEAEKYLEESAEKDDKMSHNYHQKDEKKHTNDKENAVEDRQKNSSPTLLNKKFCFHILCEHEEGWHSCSDPIPAPDSFDRASLESFSPYLARVTAILKYDKHTMLNCMAGEEGKEFIKLMEENPRAVESDFKTIYHSLRQLVMESDTQKIMGKLARCHLRNGKTIWLCEQHRSSMHVTVLNNDVVTSVHITGDIKIENLMIDAMRELGNIDVKKKFNLSKERKKLDEVLLAKFKSRPKATKPPLKIKSSSSSLYDDVREKGLDANKPTPSRTPDEKATAESCTPGAIKPTPLHIHQLKSEDSASPNIATETWDQGEVQRSPRKSRSKKKRKSGKKDDTSSPQSASTTETSQMPASVGLMRAEKSGSETSQMPASVGLMRAEKSGSSGSPLEAAQQEVPDNGPPKRYPDDERQSRKVRNRKKTAQRHAAEASAQPTRQSHMAENSVALERANDSITDAYAEHTSQQTSADRGPTTGVGHMHADNDELRLMIGSRHNRGESLEHLEEDTSKFKEQSKVFQSGAAKQSKTCILL